MAATKARAVSWPTPGIAISLRQASDTVVMRLMSASIAATAQGHHRGAHAQQSVRAWRRRKTGDPLAGFET